MTLPIASNFGKHSNIQNSFIAGENIIDQFDFHISFYIRDICYYYIYKMSERKMWEEKVNI